MNKINEVIRQLEEIDIECDKVASLAFVTWDSFENGGFKPDIESYAPALKLMCERAAELRHSFRDALDSLYKVEKAGAAE
ncbi:MAG: hypothetical protein MR278_04810 [Bacteroidales bacterium]|nr:hypothetical protein [Anaerotignum sp.]MCI5679283.1 hypothetical protein [Bacteroidales bacterium]MDY3926141.1 hypothetical protein [Anaerotignum sp.]